MLSLTRLLLLVLHFILCANKHLLKKKKQASPLMHAWLGDKVVPGEFWSYFWKSKLSVSNSKKVYKWASWFFSVIIPSIDVNGISINIFVVCPKILSVSLFKRFCLQLVFVPLQVTFLWEKKKSHQCNCQMYIKHPLLQMVSKMSLTRV